MNHNKISKINWGKLAFAMMLIICLAAVVSLMLPYESRGGALREKIELNGDSISPEAMGAIRKAILTELDVSVAGLAVKVDNDHYIGEAVLEIQSEEKLDDDVCVGIIPSPRVQRLFELAFTNKIPLKITCMRATAPAGHPLKDHPFYTVIQAPTWNPQDVSKIIGLGQIVIPGQIGL
jgi:hypothetical protein